MFRGNFGLRGLTDLVGITTEQYQEIKKCKNDPIYFIEKYIKIVDGDIGLINFKLRDFQSEYVNKIHENNKVLSIWSRQSGNSITNLSYLLWYAIFNSDKNIAYLDYCYDISSEKMKTLMYMIEELPIWIQAPIIRCSKDVIKFSNGSKIFIINNDARGYSIDLLLVSSASYILKINEILINNCNTKTIITTTGLGVKGNILINEWKKDNIIKLKYGYTRFRDSSFREMMIRRVGEIYFNSEFAIEDHEQKSNRIVDTNIY